VGPRASRGGAPASADAPDDVVRRSNAPLPTTGAGGSVSAVRVDRVCKGRAVLAPARLASADTPPPPVTPFPHRSALGATAQTTWKILCPIERTMFHADCAVRNVPTQSSGIYGISPSPGNGLAGQGGRQAGAGGQAGCRGSRAGCRGSRAGCRGSRAGCRVPGGVAAKRGGQAGGGAGGGAAGPGGVGGGAGGRGGRGRGCGGRGGGCRCCVAGHRGERFCGN
jgi:hypothetical protein